MTGLKFGAYSQAARVSNLDIDADLDMGVRSVIAAKGRFSEIEPMDESVVNITGARLSNSVFTDTLIIPYTVTPSDNVYFTSDISQEIGSLTHTPINGSIVIGPTSTTISPRLFVDASTPGPAFGSTELRVYKNGVLIATNDEFPGLGGTVAIDLPELKGGDVLTFTARVTAEGKVFTFSNFRLAGDVVKHVLDEPTAETVYD